MGRELVEFGAGELRVVGGDYGQLVVEGTTEEARRAIHAIATSVGRGSVRVVVSSLVIEHDDQADLFEDRHAGREGTPESGVGPEPTNDEGGAQGGTRDRRAARAK
jgi:hypothetical protein